MNRQQRREAAKRARADAIVRTEREHEERKIEDRISIVMIEQFYTAAALALRDEFGWGQQRIARMWKRMNELMFSIGEEKKSVRADEAETAGRSEPQYLLDGRQR